MAGTITIKDNATVKYQLYHKSVRHDYEVKLDKWEAPGDAVPPIDHLKTVVHVITVDFELIDRGTYDGGQNPGLTGTIWKQKSLLDDLRNQASNNDYYTLYEDDDTVETSGWDGVIEKIMTDRSQTTQSMITGTIVFVESNDVYNM
jgi:hypothetical protein